MVARGWGQQIGGVSADPLSQVVNRPQWRFEIVRGDIGKLIQFLQTPGQFDCPLLHLIFQLLVELLQCVFRCLALGNIKIDTEHTLWPALRISDSNTALGQPTHLAIGVNDPKFARKVAALHGQSIHSG